MAHAYWRLYFPNGPRGEGGYRGDSGVCVTGVEMRETQGGANAAVGGTASADRSDGSNTPENGFLPYSGTRRWQSDGFSGSGYGDEASWMYPHYLAYHFTTDVEIEEVAITGVAGSRSATNPARLVLQFSDDGVDWFDKYAFQTSHPWATDGSDVRLFNAANAVQYSFISVGSLLSLINYPAQELRAAGGQVVTAIRQMADIRVQQASVVSLVRGRTYNPKLRAWTYTLDGHDFYVLRLGDTMTLVYDLSTEEWSWFSSGSLNFWRPNTGINWYSAGTIPEQYGSNVVCGDDTFGHLWVLNPEQGYDDYPADPPGDPQRFPRLATGQVITRQRIFLPVYEVYLTASFGEPVADGDGVELLYSDDLGNSYVSAGVEPVTEGDFNQEFAWRSLGQIGKSGRLFRLSDDGAFARIDGLDCHIGGVSDG